MGSDATWSWDENTLFENALAIYGVDTPEAWQKVTAAVGGGKTVEDVKCHYQKLVDDLDAIESGKVPLPKYEDDTEDESEEEYEEEYEESSMKSGENNTTMNKK